MGTRPGSPARGREKGSSLARGIVVCLPLAAVAWLVILAVLVVVL